MSFKIKLFFLNIKKSLKKIEKISNKFLNHLHLEIYQQSFLEGTVCKKNGMFCCFYIEAPKSKFFIHTKKCVVTFFKSLQTTFIKMVPKE